jgi:hypothetical protein
MSKRLKQAAVIFIVVLAAAQLVRPERANPPTDVRRTIQAHVGTANGLGRPGSVVPRLSFERNRVAVVHANRARILADGIWSVEGAKGGQLFGVGRLSAGT